MTIPKHRLESWQSAEIECRYCGKPGIVRFGFTSGGIRRFLCRGCGRTFVDSGAPAGMRFPVEVIASALNQFYEGSSLYRIKRQLHLDFGQSPDHSSIQRWIPKYASKAAAIMAAMKLPNSGHISLEHTRVSLRHGSGTSLHTWDVLDNETLLLLVSHSSVTGSWIEASSLLTKVHTGGEAMAWSDERPFPVVTAAHGTAGQPTEDWMTAEMSAYAIDEHSRNSLKLRKKIVASLGNAETAQQVVSGWWTHYNFFRPHRSLYHVTPAFAAGVRAPVSSWAEIVAAPDM